MTSGLENFTALAAPLEPTFKILMLLNLSWHSKCNQPSESIVSTLYHDCLSERTNFISSCIFMHGNWEHIRETGLLGNSCYKNSTSVIFLDIRSNQGSSHEHYSANTNSVSHCHWVTIFGPIVFGITHRNLTEFHNSYYITLTVTETT